MWYQFCQQKNPKDGVFPIYYLVLFYDPTNPPKIVFSWYTFLLLAEVVELYFEFWRHKKLYVEIENAVNKTNLRDHDLQFMYVSKT